VELGWDVLVGPVAHVRSGEGGAVRHHFPVLARSFPGRQISLREYLLQATPRVERSGRLRVLMPEENYHRDVEQWGAGVATRPGVDEDLLWVPVAVKEDDRTSFQIPVNLPMDWLWIGGHGHACGQSRPCG